MKVTLTSTSKIVEIQTARGDVVPARVWEGMTETGAKVHALVTRIACDADDQETCARFAAELQECAPPSPKVTRFYDARLIL